MNSSSVSSSCHDLQPTADKVNKLSAFEELPLELRWKIYKDLLNAEKVRQPPDSNLVCHYHFQPAILCVNRKFHDEAWPFLYRENQFITVSCNWDSIYDMMSGHEVAAITSPNQGAIGRFKESILRLHIKFPSKEEPYKNESGGKVVKNFLLVVTELPNFVRMLSVIKTLTPGAVIKLKFHVDGTTEGPPSLATQKAVMEPFRALLANSQSVKLGGAIDPGYALSLKNTIDSEIRWVRGAIWEMHDLVMSHKARGDRYFELGNMSHAWETYNAGKVLLDIGRKYYPSRILDLTLYTLYANMTLTMLRKQEYSRVLEKTQVFVTANLHKNVIEDLAFFVSRVYAYRALAYMFTGRQKEAILTLRVAARANPTDETAEAYGKMTAAWLSRDERKAAANKLFSSLGNMKEQITVPLPPTPSDAINIAKERYLLQKLGYEGDYLPAIKEARPLSSEETAKLTRLVEKYKATVSPGASFKVIVAEGGRLATWRELLRRNGTV